MRPTLLSPLFATLRALDGVGPRLEGAFAKALGRSADEPSRIIDLLFHLPVALIDRRIRHKVIEARVGEIVTLKLEISQHRVAPAGRYGARRPFRVIAGDETGELQIVYFNADPNYIKRILPVGGRRIVSGRFEIYDGIGQIPHPDHVVAPEQSNALPSLEPVYPLSAGLTGKIVRKAVLQALDRIPDLPEWQDAEWLRRNDWPSFADALHALHSPAEPSAVGLDAIARERLAYDEFLANQLALALVRRTVRRSKGRPLTGDGRIRNAILSSLPFTLTGAQHRALGEIDADLASPNRMLRLIQGDVGSGKTVLALLSMATAAESGAQAALMAPTDLLVRQHDETLQRFGAAGLRIALLTGREKGRARDEILARLREGEIDVLVGTHALFQQDVGFRDLALVVIDEQHRFGVHQRLALQAKAAHADVLVMTATPIPRTLLLTHYGDMDVSRLDEKPPGRKPIATRVLPDARLDEVIAAVGRAIEAGAQAYWICPLVEDSEKSDMAAAEKRAAHLRGLFRGRVGLVHGRMRGAEKDAAMGAFGRGETSILVSTTVIEVGVDVPKASVMVIEHAERFGLAQLHQLRGRIGRGETASTCLLLYHAKLSDSAKARLEVMRETEDGFRIAEEDLRLRGGGEALGARQSGLPDFRVASLPEHERLLAAARDGATLILSRNPKLEGPQGDAVRTLLYLFDLNEAVPLLRAG